MKTVLLLVGSNLFMTYAWYGHLRTLRSAPWHVAVLASWGIAFFEYALQVPANRIGYFANHPGDRVQDLSLRERILLRGRGLCHVVRGSLEGARRAR
jgi:uncharacterized protein (DUF486 family)